jgi:hypothetical protein
MRGKTEEKVVTKNLLSPAMATGVGKVADQSRVNQKSGFTPTVISFGENTRVEKGCESKGRSSVGRAVRRYAVRRQTTIRAVSREG